MKKLTFVILSPRGDDTLTYDLELESEKVAALAEAESLLERGMARRGRVRQGLAGLGMARLGKAR